MTNAFNKFFDKIYVISLYDKFERWKKIEKQFGNRKIKVERFIAVDGRCKNEGEKACMDKLKSFEIAFDVTILDKKSKKQPVQELLPAASLTIGTILILRDMVRKNLKHILICEDDVVLTHGIETKFKQGLKEIGNYKWDVLYLGCGGRCGYKGVSYEKTSTNKFLSGVPAAEHSDDEYYVAVAEDLRMPCEQIDCIPFSDHISFAKRPAGTWAYAYSLEGAKKMLKLIDDNASNHIDHLLREPISEGKIKALSFDPPIVWHEGGIARTDSDIPWE